MIEQELSDLLKKAKSDNEIKKLLINTKNHPDPMSEFCSVCQKLGYNITVGELFALGMDMNDSKMRSVNGGGAFEIEGWDDAYENFFLQLEWTE
ncbi:MAG: hypothetical protein ACI4HO_05985 [Ruminococcus sp.]